MRKTALILCLTLLFVSISAAAYSEDVKLSIRQDSTIKDVLIGQLGKRVALRLDSSDEIEGVVVVVGDGLVHLTKITGKEYFDSVVRIDRISAVRIRVRER